MTNIPPPMRRILELARWAPSGDNTQPWRFEIAGPEHVVIHGHDTRDHVVYDLDGHASQLAVGALLETLDIAATAESRAARISRRSNTPENHLQFDVRFEALADVAPDPLLPFIEKRAVQRRAMSTRELTNNQKKALEISLPNGYRVKWFEGLGQRWCLARFMFDNAKVRLTIPEAFEVHRSVIEWNAQFSTDRIPDQAVGVDPLTARLMHWAMTSWERLSFLNRWLLGHLPPRLQLDLIPGLACGAHLALLADSPPVSVDDYLAAGRALQRFWLTATRLGLLVQPEMTPVIFCRYHRQKRIFTRNATAIDMAGNLNRRLTNLLAGDDVDGLFFMGRIGVGPSPMARSIRLPIDRLMVSTQKATED